MGRLCLFVAALAFASGCAYETQSLTPGRTNSDGGVGGVGGAGASGGSGNDGTGGTISPGTRSNCETCTSDIDCAGVGHRCVEMSYKGQPFPDADTGFCLKVAEGSAPDCAAPYVTVLADARSLSGGDLDSYCGIRQDLTNCFAVRAHQDAWDCASRGDEACPDGGFCDWVKVGSGGWQELCTYTCDQDSECDGPGGEVCTQHYCGF